MTPTASRIVAARRTPFAVRGGRLRDLPEDALAAAAIRAALRDATVLEPRPTLPVEEVVLGTCTGPGGDLGRRAALAAGLAAPGIAVDRQCGSGLTAIALADRLVRSQPEPAMVVAGGAESASRAPVRTLDGVPFRRAPFAPAGMPDPDMAQAAELLAAEGGLTRAAQDAWARRDRELARAAQARGAFAAEIAPLAGVDHDTIVPARVEPALGRLRPITASPAGHPDWAPTVAASNSTRDCDGAAAAVLVPDRADDPRPGLRVRAAIAVPADPARPGLGAAVAVPVLLDRAGVTLDEVAAIELVEAFAAQTLAVLDALGLRERANAKPRRVPGARSDATVPPPAAPGVVDARVDADGGTLAWGHPWGASGAATVVRLFTRLVRSGAPAGTLGLAAVSIGGGQGEALIVEVVR